MRHIPPWSGSQHSPCTPQLEFGRHNGFCYRLMFTAGNFCKCYQSVKTATVSCSQDFTVLCHQSAANTTHTHTHKYKHKASTLQTICTENIKM